jgi:hypothetical protein
MGIPRDLKNFVRGFFTERKKVANSDLMTNYINSTKTKGQPANQMKTRRSLGWTNKRPIIRRAQKHKRNRWNNYNSFN